MTELAERFEVSLSTVHREVRRLIEADLVTERPVGRSILMRANTGNRAAAALTELLTVTFGPEAVVAEEFDSIPAVRTVLIFGSWAARRTGSPGGPPNDIDVLVLGEPSRADIYDAADRARQRLNIQVNPVIRPADRWLEMADPLIQQIKSSPFVLAYGELPDDEG